MHRFFVDASQVLEKVILIEGDDVKHIRKVLRLRIGDEIEVSDSTAWEYRCRILSMDEHLVEATIIDKQRFAREPQLEITLYQGVAVDRKSADGGRALLRRARRLPGRGGGPPDLRSRDHRACSYVNYF